MFAHFRHPSAIDHRAHSTTSISVSPRIENLDSTPVYTSRTAPTTPTEYIVLLLTIGVFIALLLWLGHIFFKYTVPWVKQALHDLRVGRAHRQMQEQVQEDVEAVLEAPKALSRIGTGLGHRISQFLSSWSGTGDSGRANWEVAQERQRLINERVVAQRRPIFENSHGTDGQSESMDGTVDGESTRPTAVHRDDCEQNCGLRRRSWDYV